MQQIILIATTIAQLFPAVVAAIKAVEDALPDGGQGAAKLEMVRAILQAGFNSAEGISVTFEHVWPAVQNIVAQMVKAFNTIGLFRKA